MLNDHETNSGKQFFTHEKITFLILTPDGILKFFYFFSAPKITPNLEYASIPTSIESCRPGLVNTLMGKKI